MDMILKPSVRQQGVLEVLTVRPAKPGKSKQSLFQVIAFRVSYVMREHSNIIIEKQIEYYHQ
jgi:hypothetical protein